MGTTQEYMTVPEAAEWSGYHADHLRELIRYGLVKAEKKEGRWRVDVQSLAEYIETKGYGSKRKPKDELLDK